MLLAIDPGADTGWALFANNLLAACGLGEPPDDTDSPWMYQDKEGERGTPLSVIIECPRLRPRGEKNPNSILLVARNAGEWGGRYGWFGAQVRYVLPNDWKGTVSKEISHARMWVKLTEVEKGIVDECFRSAKGRNGMAPGKRHNVLDALGIGLWGVGR